MKNLILLLIGFFIAGSLYSQTVQGTWKTIDDETGKPKSIVKLYEEDGKLFGEIVELMREPQEEQNPICDECEDDRKDKKVLGMQIVRDLEWDEDDNEWDDGTICDPKDGKIYDLSLIHI